MTSDVPPFRFVGSVKNNRLWRAILDQWPDVTSQSDAGRRLDLHPTGIGKLLNGGWWPYWKSRGVWSPVALRIAEALHRDPEYLFDPALYGRAWPKRIEVECGPKQLAAATARLALPAAFDVTLERREALEKALKLLRPREARVLRLHYLEDKSLDEVAERFRITKERIRQIAARGVMKLRELTKSGRLLDGFRDEFSGEYYNYQ